MIAVAILASSAMARALLEALVSAQPALRLVSAPLALAAPRDQAMGAIVEADVLLIEPGARPAEAVLRGLPQVPRLPPVVLLVSDVAPATFGRLLRAGARAILLRDAPAPEVLAAIDAVRAGLIVLHPSTALASVAKAAGRRRAQDEVGSGPLTPRELEILTMMAEGTGNRAIARLLGISPHTVKFHIASILDKLNARSRTEAVAIGMRLGLLMV